jgi:hypothetical protein
MENKIENWKDVSGYEGAYQVSDFGRVRSCDRVVLHNFGGEAKRKGQILKGVPDKDGYLKVNLKCKQIGKSSIVHRLVAIAFIPNPENKPHVNHKDGIKNNNVLSNLEWNTLCENRQHAYDTGLQHSYTRQGEKSNFNKLKESEVLEIRSIYKKGVITHKQIAEKYNVSVGAVQAIINRVNWKQI